MEKQLILTTSCKINAPIEKVWDALTNPVMIKKYFFGTEAVSDWKVGSPLIFRGEWEGKAYEDKGIILELEKNKKLKYNYWSSFSGTEDIPENYANITYELAREGNVTIFTLTQDGFKDEEQKAHSEKNWKMLMDAMKALIE
ncbi:MAG TPA: SRPBCC family protein [Cytophagaceae bacterium]|nr:SRPBCC family protein [Cytophagaceae bacterium]